MARVSLIYFDIDTGFYPGLHHGLASLAAVIRQAGHDLEFHHCVKEDPPEVLSEKILKFKPDVVGFSLTTNQRQYLEKYSAAIAGKSDVLQVAGGIHATVAPLDLLNIQSIRGVCLGEGEQAFLCLLGKLDAKEPLSETESFWWRAPDGSIKKNAVLALDPDLSKLPYPDYSIFDLPGIIRASAGWMNMILTRGCPHDCSYCCNHCLRAVYPAKKDYVRIPPVEYALAKIKHSLSYAPGVKGIIFSDDLLICNKQWFQEFSKRYVNEIRLPFICNARVEYLSEEICEMLKKAGCILVQMGVETGSEWLRKKILNRKMSNAQIIKGFQTLKKYGIQTFSYNIVGLPFETKEMMAETLALNKILAPEWGTVAYFFPYPGTRLYELCEEFGLLNPARAKVSGFLEGPSIHPVHCKTSDCIKAHHKLMLYLLARRASKDFGAASRLISMGIYFLLSLSPAFFVGLITKRSWIQNLIRKIHYRKISKVR